MMKKRLKTFWAIVAATMFWMMPENLQAQRWTNGGIKVSIVGGCGYLKVSSRYGPGGLFGKVEQNVGGGSAYPDVWNCSDYTQITEKWNFEVGYWPYGRLWKMEMRDLKSGNLIQTYYPENLKDKGNGRYEFEVNNARSLDGRWLQWYTMDWDNRGVEVYSYFQQDDRYPIVRRDEAGSATAYNGKNPVSDAESGSILTLVANPNPGYAFKRWEVTKGYSILRGDELFLNSDTRVAAIFMPVTQAVVTFDPQGGTLESTTASPNAEGKFTSLPTPTLEGYSFEGWYDKDGNPFTTESVVKRDMTLYARWDTGFFAETTEIDFGRALEGYTNLAKKPIQVSNRYDVTVWPLTEETGNYNCTYSGIPANSTGNLWVGPADGMKPGTHNRTMYVRNNKDSSKYPVNLKFKVEPVYTIKFELAGGVGAEGFAATTTTNLNFRAEVWPADPTRAGHEFLGWYDRPDYDGDWNPLGNKYDNKSWFDSSRTLYAKWRKVVYLDKTELDFGTVKKGYTPVAPQMLVLRNLSKSDIQLFDQNTYSFNDIENPSIVFYDQEGPYNISGEETVLQIIDNTFEYEGNPRWEQAFKFTLSPKTGLAPGEYNLDGNIQWRAKNGGAGSSEWFTIRFKVEDGEPDPVQPDDGEKRVVQMQTAGIEKLNTIYYGRKLTNLSYDEAVPSWYVVDNEKDILGDLGGMYLLAKTLYGKEDGHLIPYKGIFADLFGLLGNGYDDIGLQEWQSSLVRDFINVLWHSNFSEVEKAAVRNIEKTEEEIDESTEEAEFIYVENTVNDKLFPLSMNEVLDLPNELTTGFYKGEKHSWWLRSIEKTPYRGKKKNTEDFYILDYYFSDGGIEITIVFKTDEEKKKFEEANNNAKSSAPRRASSPAKAGEELSPTDYLYLPWVYGNDDLFYTAAEKSPRHGVRPAFNLSTGSVFMSSAAVGGKESGPLGSRALRKVRKSNPTEWKLTLIDTLRTGFTVAVDGYTPATSNSMNVNRRVINSGAVMTIHYSGAPTGPNEFVSVVLKRSSDNEVLYYGTIAANRASGDVTIPIPNDLEADKLYEVLIFSEQKNGDYYTDYVSPVVTYYIQMEKTEVILLDDDYPFDEGDDPYNTIVINRNKGFDTKYVRINSRTLCRDGRWNTICLPFNLADGNPDDGISFTGTLLEGATVKRLVSSDYTPATSTLTLNFETVEAMEAGKPYIVRWPSEANLADVTSPVFNGVTISDAGAGVTETEYTDFIGLYSSIYIGGLDRTMLYMGGDSKLYYPNDEMFINSFRGYFRLKKNLWASDIPGTTSAKTFVVNLGGDVPTGVSSVDGEECRDDSWYSVDGRKLQGEPVQKGVYVRNGRKVVVK